MLRFNGTPVRNLRHLAELVSTCCAEASQSAASSQGNGGGAAGAAAGSSPNSNSYLRFDLEYNEVVVLKTDEAAAAATDVMASHGVPFLMSADLRAAGLAWPPSSTA